MANVIPPNDPARPCWKIFADILGREDPIPTDAKEASDRLKALLLEAYTDAPYKLFRMALCSESKRGGMKGKIAALAKSMKASGLDLTTSLSRTGGGKSDLEQSFSDPAWRSAVEYILSQWWSMGEGGPTTARAAVYKEMGTSTNEPIRCYLPNQSGVVPYLRARTQHILLAYYEKLRSYHKMLSLDKCTESGLELTTNGTFAIPALGADTEFVELSAEVEGGGHSELADAFNVNGADQSERFETEDRLQRDKMKLDRKIEKTKHQSIGDWPLRVFQSGYDAAAADSVHVKDHALALLNALKELDASIAEEYDAVREAIADWDGSRTIVEFVPELADAAARHRYRLVGIERAPEAQANSDVVNQLLQMDLFSPTAEEIESAPALPHSHMAIANGEILLEDMLNADDIDIDDGARMDHIFLAEQAHVAPRTDLTGEELHRELRYLRDVFVDRLRRNRADEMAGYVAKWDPALEGFSRPLMRATRQMAASKERTLKEGFATREAKYLPTEARLVSSPAASQGDLDF